MLVQLASYQEHGEVALGGNATSLAATWRVRLAGKPQEQVAFAAFDAAGRQVAKTRGVGGTAQDVPPRVFAAGNEWTVVWFDANGLAYARPYADPLPAPDVLHLSAVSPETSADVALAPSPHHAVLASTPFGAEHAQLGLFLLADEKDLALVKALGVTHHGKAPHHAAIAASETGLFVGWEEAGALVASHFDAAGKENDAECILAPASSKPERLAMTTTGTGVIASWMEGTAVRVRALDARGCPAGPTWTVGQGHAASLSSTGDSAVVAWVSADNRLLAARLGANGEPPARGLDASEGTAGVRDAPTVFGFGASKLAFAWSEAMSPTVRTKRLQIRVVDAACLP